MKIDRTTLEKTTHLARLKFDEGNAQAMLEDLSKILDWVEKLNELDTAGVEPLSHMATEENIMREDEPQPPLVKKAALNSAPQADSDYFRVPKVLD